MLTYFTHWALSQALFYLYKETLDTLWCLMKTSPYPRYFLAEVLVPSHMDFGAYLNVLKSNATLAGGVQLFLIEMHNFLCNHPGKLLQLLAALHPLTSRQEDRRIH